MARLDKSAMKETNTSNTDSGPPDRANTRISPLSRVITINNMMIWCDGCMGNIFFEIQRLNLSNGEYPDLWVYFHYNLEAA